jgi:hypothetical protein
MTTASHAHDHRSAGAGRHSLRVEGARAGLLGGLAIGLWYLVTDALAGHPLHTIHVLGTLIFRGGISTVPEPDLDVVVGYSVLHVIAFILLGWALAGLIHLTVRDIRMRMGLWLTLVMAFFLLSGIGYTLSLATGEQLRWWTLIGGSLVSVAVMGTYLWHRHPRLRESLREVPLGDEVPAPEHPPERPK